MTRMDMTMKNAILVSVLIAGMLGGGCRLMSDRTPVADRIASRCRIVSQDEWFGHPRVVFDITKAYRVFEIYDSVEAAVAAFATPS